MLSPFDFIFRAPFSGDVTQEITPRILSPDIQGSPAIEHRVQTEVASYGKQLGKVLEALQTLSAATNTPLPEIDALVGDVENVKGTAKQALRREAEEALSRLKSLDPDGHAALLDGR